MAARHACTFGGGAGGVTQGVLFLVALASLAWKRHVETPRRSVRVWGFDVSKQGLSSAAAHLSGMLWSHVLSGSDASECAYYAVVFTVDTTVGVALALALHRRVGDAARREAGKLERMASSRWSHALARSGYYGDPPSGRVWGMQLAAWCTCVVFARTACGLLVLLLRPALRWLPAGIDALFAGKPQLELATVMVICPLCMNLVQAWVQDAYLKAGGGGGGGGGGSGGALRSGSPRAAAARDGGFYVPLEAVLEARPSQECESCDGGSRRGSVTDAEQLLRLGGDGSQHNRGDS